MDVGDADFWTPGYFRLFVSHLTEHGSYVEKLKMSLRPFHVSTFVAHIDITPTREWEDEIRLALRTADALVALLHEGFHGSPWTTRKLVL